MKGKSATGPYSRNCAPKSDMQITLARFNVTAQTILATCTYLPFLISSWSTHSRIDSFSMRLASLKKVKQYATPVVLSDGDVVFQPHKIRRSGLYDAFDGAVLVYVHK